MAMIWWCTYDPVPRNVITPLLRRVSKPVASRHCAEASDAFQGHESPAAIPNQIPERRSVWIWE